MNISYTFKNGTRGSADGVITVELDGFQINESATVTLFWSSEENIPLSEYTPLVTLSAASGVVEFTLDKQLQIPLGAKYLSAVYLCEGVESNCSLALPESKLALNSKKPLYTVGFASDFHIGGWGSESAPKEGLIKAREQFNRLADLLVTEGDLVQWHGCYSREEFIHYNYDRETKKWGDNGVRDTEHVEIGHSQWKMLEEYLHGFTIPVYHCQGNHDIIDEDHWSPMCGNKDYFGDFLTKWIRESEASGKYDRHIERDESVHYYETVIMGHKFVFTEAPHPYPPHHTIGKEELDWLDRVLFDGEESGKPIFVMGHSPIDERLNKKTAYANFTDLDELKKVLSKHPTVVYVSGHSHFTLDTPLRNAIDGRQEEPSHLHNGGMTTVIDPPPMTQYDITHGTLAEVYDDRILLRGRNFSSGEWISLAHSELTMKKPCTSGRLWIERSDGNILVANAENEDGIGFEWYLDGVLVSDKRALTLPADFKGYVALRAKDTDGGFKSVIYNI